MQHVLFAINNFPPSIGGVEMHVSHLADELVALGHRVTVVTVSNRPGSSIEHGVRVVRVRGLLRIGDVLSFPVPGTGRRLRRHVAEHKVTVISTHTRFFPMSVIGARASRRCAVPFVHTEHGSDYVRGVSLPIAWASRLVDYTLGRRVLRRANAVLAVSEAVAAFVKRLSGVEARVFHNAIDTAPWIEARPAAPAGSTRLSFLGRLVPGKGWEDFLDVVAASVAGGESPRADLIGDGPDRERVEAAVVERGLQPYVTVRGRLEGAELIRTIAGSTLVNPTVLAEGFQTSLLEVLAAGGRVVTYPVPGAEVLRRQGAPIEITGERTPASLVEALRRLAADDAPMFSEEALAEWDWASRAREYVDVLDGVTEHAPADRSSGRL